MNWPEFGLFVWPAAVLLIVWYFKEDPRGLFSRITRAGIGSPKVEFGAAESDKDDREATAKRPVNVFWLGHDLMWTADVILRGGPKERIVHGLNQCLTGLESLALQYVEPNLRELLNEAITTREEDWDLARRLRYANDIARLIRVVGDVMKASQKSERPRKKS